MKREHGLLELPIDLIVQESGDASYGQGWCFDEHTRQYVIEMSATPKEILCKWDYQYDLEACVRDIAEDKRGKKFYLM
jgi:hypothetical protein